MKEHGRPRPLRRAVASALVVAAAGFVGAASTAARVRSPLASQTPVSSRADAPTVDVGWPRGYTTTNGSTVVVHQPQVASWADRKHMLAIAAVEYAQVDVEKPILGTIKLEADTSVAVAERLVSFTSLVITEMHLPGLSKEQSSELSAELVKAIPPKQRIISLDRVLTSIDKSSLTAEPAPGIKADPPTIFVSRTPAVLVCLDGAPIWSPVEGNDLKFAVNTNWDLFFHEPTNTYYLRNEDSWVAAESVAGPWHPAGTLPASFASLPNDENWKDVKAQLPGKRTHAADVVFTSSEPAELVRIDGEPRYQAVGRTSLAWISNTDSDLFRVGTTGPLYFLVAGRWFSAPDFDGPWTFASTSLPEDFKRIPREHPRGRVLASVPGTDAAMEAIVLAGVPRTARVNTRELKAPPVTFQDTPTFEAIGGTSVERATNTDKDVFRVGDRYYLCFQGVWFTASGPSGPWQVATSVPDEIYAIPASSPSHHVTYVEVEEDADTSDEWVTYDYGAGYTGVMMGWGSVVWGTGWYYPPYVGWAAGYPIYYPYMWTYGYSAWYNPWTGTYGASARAYGPYGGAGFGARYNPYTGTYARGAMAWGAYGARGAAEAWNPRTGTYAATRQGGNLYGSWGSTNVQRGDDWMQTKHASNRANGTATRVTRTDDGGMVTHRGPDGGSFVLNGNDNVYAGNDGNVYRRNESGEWQQWDQGNWGSAERPDRPERAERPQAETMIMEGPPRRAETPAERQASTRREAEHRADSATRYQLERERAARVEATNRSRDFDRQRVDRSPRVAPRPSGGRPNVGGGGGRPAGGGGRRGRS